MCQFTDIKRIKTKNDRNNENKWKLEQKFYQKTKKEDLFPLFILTNPELTGMFLPMKLWTLLETCYRSQESIAMEDLLQVQPSA